MTVKMTGKAKQMRHVQLIRFLSSDDTIASVTRTGKITARTKGTCFIYACGGGGTAGTATDNRAVKHCKIHTPSGECIIVVRKNFVVPLNTK